MFPANLLIAKAIVAALCLASASLPGPALAADKASPVGVALGALDGATQVSDLARRPVNPRKRSHLILEEDRALREFDRDRSLTELCRAGRFRQKQEHFLIVKLAGFVYGAVVGGHWSLYDPEGLAVPNLVYAIKGQDTARCDVYVIRHLSPGE